MDSAGITGTVFLGLVLGSFATALSYRLPRGLPMLTMARSQCPACQRQLKARDLIPLFSFIFLKGRCRACNARIGWRYPLIELATLALCLVFYALYGLSLETLPLFILAPVVISLIDIDLRYKIIPDSFNLFILLTGAALLGLHAPLAASSLAFVTEKGGAALAGVALYGGGAFALRWLAMLLLKREALGLGDVKFFAAAGFWLGLNADAAALFMIVSGLCGMTIALIWQKLTGETEAPFGPSLMVGFVTILCLYTPDFMNI